MAVRLSVGLDRSSCAETLDMTTVVQPRRLADKSLRWFVLNGLRWVDL